MGVVARILTEVWLASFLRHNFGFYCGMFIASIILILPLVSALIGSAGFSGV